MKTKYSLTYSLLLFPFLLMSQFQEPYIFYTKNGDSLNTKLLLVEITENKQVEAFNIEGTLLTVDNILAFRKGNNYYHLAGIDKKGNLNLFKRDWYGDKIALFYKNTLKVVSFPRVEIESTKDFFYNSNHGTMTVLNYENLKRDLVIPVNRNLGKLFSKINNIRKLRKLSVWVGIGALLYSAYQLDQNRRLASISFLPVLAFGYTTFTIHKEKRLLEKAVKIY